MNEKMNAHSRYLLLLLSPALDRVNVFRSPELEPGDWRNLDGVGPSM